MEAIEKAQDYALLQKALEDQAIGDDPAEAPATPDVSEPSPTISKSNSASEKPGPSSARPGSSRSARHSKPKL